MPVKRRVGKARLRISPEAVARWRVVRPHGIHFGGPHPKSPADFVDDEELGELLGIPALLAWESEVLRAVFDALEEAVAH